MNRAQPRVKVINHVAGRARDSSPRVRVFNHVAGQDTEEWVTGLLAYVVRVEQAAAKLRGDLQAGRIKSGDAIEIGKACRNFISWAS